MDDLFMPSLRAAAVLIFLERLPVKKGAIIVLQANDRVNEALLVLCRMHECRGRRDAQERPALVRPVVIDGAAGAWGGLKWCALQPTCDEGDLGVRTDHSAAPSLLLLFV